MDKLSPEVLVETYNPANAKNLSAEQIHYMRTFTLEEIAILAKAYPNQARSNNYLVLFNKNVADNKQSYQLSTYSNLKSLWALGKKEFSIFTFRTLFSNPSQAQASARAIKKDGKVVDLTDKDLNDAAGLKKGTETAQDVITRNKNLNVAAKAIENENAGNAATDEATELTVLKNSLTAAEEEHASLVSAKAHHMTIKSKQAEIDSLISQIEAFGK